MKISNTFNLIVSYDRGVVYYFVFGDEAL